MRNVLLASAVALPLAGCGWIMDFNVFESYKQWCEETWGIGWPCTVEYAHDTRMDLLSHEGGESNKRSRHEEHDNEGSSGEGEGEGESSD